MFLVGESVEMVKRDLCWVQIYEPLWDLYMRPTALWSECLKIVSASLPNQVASLNHTYTPNIV